MIFSFHASYYARTFFEFWELSGIFMGFAGFFHECWGLCGLFCFDLGGFRGEFVPNLAVIGLIIVDLLEFSRLWCDLVPSVGGLCWVMALGRSWAGVECLEDEIGKLFQPSNPAERESRKVFRDPVPRVARPYAAGTSAVASPYVAGAETRVPRPV